MRAFIAIPLPAATTSALARTIRDLERFSAHVRFTAAPSIHLTLKFLGEIEPASARRLGAALRKAAARHVSFELALTGLGAFPNLRSPRVIWVGLGGGGARLADLQAGVEAACLALGFAPEERAFHPHLTLARVTGRGNSQPLIDCITMGGIPVDGRFEVRRVNLYESILGRSGACHRVLEAVDLEDPAP